MEDSNHKGPDAPEVLQLKRDLASAQERIARLESQEQGAPLGRLNAMGEFAEKRCGHNPLWAKPFEVSIIEHIDKLEERIEELKRGYELHTSPDRLQEIFAGIDSERLKVSQAWQADLSQAVRVGVAHMERANALESRLSQAREAVKSIRHLELCPAGGYCSVDCRKCITGEGGHNWIFKGSSRECGCGIGPLLAILNGTEAQTEAESDKTLLQRHMEANAKFPPCRCGGAAVGNASGDITRTCIRCGAIVLPVPHTAD